MIEFGQLVNSIETILCVPLSATCELSIWLNNPRLSFYGREDADYKRAVSTVQRKFTHFNYQDIVNLMAKTSHLVWYARSDDHYLTNERSIDLVIRLLVFQYGSVDEARLFVERLWNIVEKKIPKKNTMFVNGPANCGKSWFFDMVVSFYVNVGHVANFVRGNNFPLNDCVNRRILYWNEPSIMPSGYETLKMLSGGDPCAASVKYQSGTTIHRTPLIMTANNANIFPSGPVWDTRVFRETWKSAPMLKKVIGYPSPRCFPDLIEWALC